MKDRCPRGSDGGVGRSGYAEGTTMTKQKDLKKHIRARAAKTGESYSEARRNLLAERTVTEQKAMAKTFVKPIIDAAKRQREGLAALAAGIVVMPMTPLTFGAWLQTQWRRTDDVGVFAVAWNEQCIVIPELLKFGPNEVLVAALSFGFPEAIQRRLKEVWGAAVLEFERISGRLTVDLPPKEAAAFVEDLKQKWNETVGKDIDPALRKRMDELKVEPEERVCEQCQKPLADGEKHFRDFNIPSMRCISLGLPPTDAELEVFNAKARERTDELKVEPGDENLSAMHARVPIGAFPTTEKTTIEAQGLTDRVRELSGIPARTPPEELVQVRGFAQPVPKAMADAIEVLRQQVRDDVTKQDAVFESLFEQAKEKEPELLWVGKGGQRGQAVFRTEFDKVMVESAKAYPLTAFEREHMPSGPTPADLWRKQEASEEELKALAAAVANSPACICGPALGAVKECPFHHPPVVLDPEKTTLVAEPGVDVGRVLLDRAIKAHADGSDSKADRDRIAPSFAVKDAFKNAPASEVVSEPPPMLPVKDVAPLLEALKYINGGDAHADEAREEAREALDAFDKLHPKVLTALVDPYAKADSLDLDAEEEIAVRLNGEKVTLARVSDYETIVARAGLSGTPSMTFRKGKAGGILHPGEPLFIEKNMVLNAVHTGNA